LTINSYDERTPIVLSSAVHFDFVEGPPSTPAYHVILPGETLTVIFDLGQNYHVDNNSTYELQTKEILPENCTSFVHVHLTANSPSSKAVLKQEPEMSATPTLDMTHIPLACIPR